MEHQHCLVDFETMDDPDGGGELELWGAVLLQAIEDFHRRGSSFEIVMSGISLRGRTDSAEMRRNKRDAAAWFKSPSKDVGSFLWICDLFGLDADLIRSEVKKKSFRLRR